MRYEHKYEKILGKHYLKRMIFGHSPNRLQPLPKWLVALLQWISWSTQGWPALVNIHHHNTNQGDRITNPQARHPLAHLLTVYQFFLHLKSVTDSLTCHRIKDDKGQKRRKKIQVVSHTWVTRLTRYIIPMYGIEDRWCQSKTKHRLVCSQLWVWLWLISTNV